jgi:hypothetical protein
MRTGVKNIDTNVETKSVVVEADESVAPQTMLEKLEKVCLFLLPLHMAGRSLFSVLHHTHGWTWANFVFYSHITSGEKRAVNQWSWHLRTKMLMNET